MRLLLGLRTSRSSNVRERLRRRVEGVGRSRAKVAGRIDARQPAQVVIRIDPENLSILVKLYESGQADCPC